MWCTDAHHLIQRYVRLDVISRPRRKAGPDMEQAKWQFPAAAGNEA
jgi:hypothetical protein